ncbi:MAG: hypothetical protein H6738_09695 [Alphaproteobacteria bacterium]|nr:hypothetical protein [Alphaproteobacteria bacterium]MCB9697038.1 hypothetical protein [Alphaproteobacteria bacterium]
MTRSLIGHVALGAHLCALSVAASAAAIPAVGASWISWSTTFFALWVPLAMILPAALAVPLLVAHRVHVALAHRPGWQASSASCAALITLGAPLAWCTSLLTDGGWWSHPGAWWWAVGSALAVPGWASYTGLTVRRRAVAATLGIAAGPWIATALALAVARMS